jgi:D-glycero-D-manno-heptose 1,7-bisphosphate phosphatase
MSYQSDFGSGRDIFLDRDGVINENRADHVKSWGEFQFLPGALEALRQLTERHYRIFVVTNQAAVNRGLLTQATLEEIHRRMIITAEGYGASIAGLRFCPHLPEEACACRKPRPGMLRSLAAERQIDLSQSYFIGDALSDLAAGHAAGCRTILVHTGRGSEQLGHPDFLRHRPRHVAANLLDAVNWLFEQAQATPIQPAYAAGGRPALLGPMQPTGTV